MSKGEEKTVEMKKADRKSIIIFALAMLGCFVAGMIGGFCSKMIEDSNGFLSNFVEKLAAIINSESYYVGLLVSVIATIVAYVLYRKSRKAYETWDEEDDEVMDKIERNLSLALTAPNLALIFTYVATAIGLSQLPVFFEEGEFAIVKSILLLTGIIFSLVMTFVLNGKVVSFEKEMNPEKKGNIYDFNFQKKWMESCDEAEKLVAYKCAFASYKMTQNVCSLLILVCMLGMSNGQWGNAPVLMVGVIWLSSYLSYSAEALKLSKNAKRIQE